MTMDQERNSRRELGLDIADNGRWEEFHQKQGNYFMFDYHKERRLKLEREYRQRFDARPVAKR